MVVAVIGEVNEDASGSWKRHGAGDKRRKERSLLWVKVLVTVFKRGESLNLNGSI